MPIPENKARENIDRLITQAAWAARDQSDANILAYWGRRHSKLHFEIRPRLCRLSS